MKLKSWNILFVLLPILLLSGCAGVDNGRVRIDYERHHGEIIAVVDNVPVKKVSAGNTNMDVVMKKGKHHLQLYENRNIVLDTVMEVKNAYGAASWLSWNLGGIVFGATLAIGANPFLSTLLFFVPPIFISEDDAKITMYKNGTASQFWGKRFRTAEDGTELRYMGDEGLKMQIYGESEFVNEYENGMAISNIKVFCYNPPSGVLIKSDDGSQVKWVDYTNIRVCSGSNSDLACETKDVRFWEKFPCDSVEPHDSTASLKNGMNNKFLGYSGMKAQIVGESSLSNMSENSMAITYIENFCINPQGRVMMEIEDYGDVFSFDYKKIRVCSGSKTSLSCEVKDMTFWKDYQCKPRN